MSTFLSTVPLVVLGAASLFTYKSVRYVNDIMGPHKTTVHFLLRHSHSIGTPVTGFLHKYRFLTSGGDVGRWVVKKTDTETYTVRGFACRECGYVMAVDMDFIHECDETPFEDKTPITKIATWIDPLHLEEMERRRSFNTVPTGKLYLDDVVRRIEDNTAYFDF